MTGVSQLGRDDNLAERAKLGVAIKRAHVAAKAARDLLWINSKWQRQGHSLRPALLAWAVNKLSPAINDTRIDSGQKAPCTQRLRPRVQDDGETHE